MGRHSEVTRAPSRKVSHEIEATAGSLSSRLRSIQIPTPKVSPVPGGRSRRLFNAAFIIALGLILVNVVDPYSGAVASPYYIPAATLAGPSQSVDVNGEYSTTISRDNVTTTAHVAAVKAASASAPAAGTPDPGSAQAIAAGMVAARGWGAEQFDCLVALWNRESHWNAYAHNVGSGAYGIPQALPGEKMASAGADWATNPATQITWGLGYVEGRYGSPCGAWAHSEAKGWY